MHFELQHADGLSRFTLDEGRASVGGAASDDVHFAGLPPALLLLAVDPGGVTLVASARIEVSGVPLHPGVKRRLRGAEPVQLPGNVTLRLVGPAPAEAVTPAS